MPQPQPQWNRSFACSWRAEALDRPPLIAPARQFVYPQAVEEVERGALFAHVHPARGMQFLATFALGFQAPTLPHGLWTCPHPDELCAISGGYAYIVNTLQPEQWQQIAYRPVTAIFPHVQQRLLLFCGFHTLCAWGTDGLAWETARLSWEGLRITAVEADTLTGLGWEMQRDQEIPFTVDLRTGRHTGGAFSPPVDATR
jgi:hypothetical protein